MINFIGDWDKDFDPSSRYCSLNLGFVSDFLEDDVGGFVSDTFEDLENVVEDPDALLAIAALALTGGMAAPLLGAGIGTGALVGGGIGLVAGNEIANANLAAENDLRRAENAESRVRALNQQIKIQEQVRAAQREGASISSTLQRTGLLEAGSSVGRQAGAETRRLTSTNVRNIQLGASFEQQFSDAMKEAERHAGRAAEISAGVQLVGSIANLASLGSSPGTFADAGGFSFGPTTP